MEWLPHSILPRAARRAHVASQFRLAVIYVPFAGRTGAGKLLPEQASYSGLIARIDATEARSQLVGARPSAIFRERGPSPWRPAIVGPFGRSAVPGESPKNHWRNEILGLGNRAIAFISPVVLRVRAS